MLVSLCILAKDEAKTIGSMLSQISQQSLVRRDDASVHLHVLANGCTDATVAESQSCASLFDGTNTQLFVRDIKQGGKSRTWNTAVHDIADRDTDVFIFIDADVQLLSPQVLDELLEGLAANSRTPVFGGYPVKDVQAKPRKNLVDRFTLAISAKAKPVGVINGSLYAMRSEVAREIWLPNDIPGEDGFLNAMVTTRGFTTPLGQYVVQTARQPTHSFKAHSVRGFFAHEQRMIVGSLINFWIFEYLWSLNLTTPAGAMIREMNEADPDWVEKIIRKRSNGRSWLIPGEITLGRLRAPGKSLVRRLASAPLSLLATGLTIPPAIAANRKLKQRGAATFW